MKIAIIGAGFTGLSAAYHLTKTGHEVAVLEKLSQPGGLAIGYQEKGWEWTLEEHYHHWFTNDRAVLALAEEIGHKVIVARPRTSVFVENQIYQFDSIQSILKFPKLNYLDLLRMSCAVAALRFNPFWQPLEKINASKILPIAMGEAAYKMIWEPMLINKFGAYADDISLAWFWARIKKRTPSLAYPEGGFIRFAQHLADTIKKNGGKFYFHTEIIELSSKKNPQIKYKEFGNGKLKIDNYDAILVTLPSFLFLNIASGLPASYKNSLVKLKGLGATNLVLRLNKRFFHNNTYWLSVCDKSAPIMAIVEHTNFMDNSHYNNEHIVYLGNYLPANHPNFLASKESLFSLYDPFLLRINREYRKHLIDYKLFKASFAQPIIPANYSRMIPPFTTPLPNVYLANIEQVYPWDRGTNYSVEIGEKVAKLVTSNRQLP